MRRKRQDGGELEADWHDYALLMLLFVAGPILVGTYCCAARTTLLGLGPRASGHEGSDFRCHVNISNETDRFVWEWTSGLLKVNVSDIVFVFPAPCWTEVTSMTWHTRHRNGGNQ